jgi:hypothetical protein
MKTLHIEWKHLDKDGKTCDRCAETGATLRRVIDDLTGELAARNIRVTFTETRLSEREIPQSNSMLFNGVPLEDLLPGVQVIDNYCASCSDLCSQDTACRAIRAGETTYEAVPDFMIRQAALLATGLQTALPVRNEPAEACCACCE